MPLAAGSVAQLAGRGWASDARFATAATRVEHAAALDEAIAAWTAPQEVDALETALQTADVPSHRVSRSADAFADPQLLARDHFIPVDYAENGPLPFENARARLSATPAEPRPCPTLGEHNQTVLSDLLGLDDDAITELIIAGAIE